MTVSPEQKVEIVKRLMEVWAPRPNDTLMEVYPSEGWPESIRNCNMREFLTQVFNSNPKSVTERGVPSAEAYVEEIKKEFGSSS
jgi:hypothetical protein